MNIQPRQLVQTALLLLLPCFLVLIFVISTQSTDQINFIDNYWYLNRARLIWHGILPDLFVYTLAYPTFVGAINLVVNDAILSGMLANTVLLWCILLGTYILGHWLYGGNRVAWLAVLLLLLNASFAIVLRLFWATIPFTAATVWIVVGFMFVVRRPSFGAAVFLGGILAVATYTRVEGVTYSILIPIAAWVVYRQRHDRGLALRIFFTAGLTLVILCIPFALNFLYINQHIDHELSEAVTGIFTLLNRTPVEWFVIWRRVTDTLTGLLSHWPLLAWIIGIAGVLWASPRFRVGQWLCATLIGFNLLYAFVLTIWPISIHVIFYVPFLALILAATFDQLLLYRRWSKYLVQPLVGLIVLPGIFQFVTQATNVPVMNYRNVELAQTGKALDGWLQQKGWAQSHIYTFCPSIISFSHADFQLIYRLEYTTGWDTPTRLFPKMREEGALMMLCGEQVYVPDWRPLLVQDVPPGLHEVGRFQKYIFYRPDGV